jgi:hypothetical protein
MNKDVLRVRKIIEDEIRWHEKDGGLSSNNTDYKIGFIDGIKQSLGLFNVYIAAEEGAESIKKCKNCGLPKSLHV